MFKLDNLDKFSCLQKIYNAMKTKNIFLKEKYVSKRHGNYTKTNSNVSCIKVYSLFA